MSCKYTLKPTGQEREREEEKKLLCVVLVPLSQDLELDKI